MHFYRESLGWHQAGRVGVRLGVASFVRYAHTLRHLRPAQIYGRVWARLWRPRPALRPASCRRTAMMTWPGPWLRRPSLLGDAQLSLLGDERTLTSAGDWQYVHSTALWLYNLHYFEDLNAAGDGRLGWQRALIERWIADNPPAVGVGWDPYPASLRLVNWIRWLLRGNEPLPGMLDSLAIQTRWLQRRIEHHLLGNHLLVNCKALLFAGTFFTGVEADAWRHEGARLLARELDEQILADGGHFERSPMYHALIFEDVLDLIALHAVFPGTMDLDAKLRAIASRMEYWLDSMTHPDGEIAMFNDSTRGVAATPLALAGFARDLGIEPIQRSVGVTELAASGYTRVQRGDAVLFVDTGEIGPSYTPAHGHADTLSFELSIEGRRIIVDSGVSEYGTSPERVRQRGTAAHNTIVVDGADSSEVWSGFRVARRAHVAARSIEERAASVTVRGEHDGYRRLAGRVTHARLWRVEDGILVIEDELRGKGWHRADTYYHFAPGIRPQPVREFVWALGPQLEIETDPACKWTIEQGTVHPAMGSVIDASVLHGQIRAALPVRLRTQIRWR
ncbi:N/A [soil metagenome]